MYYLVSFLFVILSAKASFMDLTNMCWVLIDIIFLWVGFEKARFRKSDFELFGKFAAIYISYCTVRSFFFVHLPVSFYINDIVFLFKYIFTSFLFCAVLKEQAVHYFVKIVFQLAILSLPLYCLQLVAGDQIYSFGRALGLPHAHFNGYANMIVFTYVKQHEIRNSGFSWEPGAFGFFLNLGLLLHLVTNNFTFDKRAIWIVIAIFTTLSTTTYVAFIFVILIYFRGRGVKFITILALAGPVLCAAATMLPFMVDKIVMTYNSDMEDIKNIHFLSEWYVEHGLKMPLNRFASLLYLQQLFGYNLVLGLSNDYSKTVPILSTVSLSNGIYSFLTQFGGIGMLLLLQRFYLFLKKNSGSFELSLYCILVILISGFGECIFVTSIILCFLFLYHYSVPQPAEDEVEYNEEGLDNTQIMLAR